MSLEMMSFWPMGGISTDFGDGGGDGSEPCHKPLRRLLIYRFGAPSSRPSTFTGQGLLQYRDEVTASGD